MSAQRTNARRIVTTGIYGYLVFSAMSHLCSSAVGQVADVPVVAGSRTSSEDRRETRDGKWLKNAIDKLPPGVPANAQEVKSGVKLLLAEGIGPEKVELGTLQTGTHYFTEIEFVNMLDKPITITDIKSSCGCLAASKVEQQIKPGHSSSLVAILSPQLHNGKYAKSLTILTDSGVTLPILVTAEFKQPFSISSEVIQFVDRSKTIVFSIRSDGLRDMSDLSFKPITGSLKVRETRAIAPGEWEILCTASVDVAYAIRPITERLAVTRRDKGETICELSVTLDPGKRMAARPDRIRLRSDGDEYVGRILLFGDLSTIDWTKEFTVALATDQDSEGKRATAIAEVVFRSSKMARLNVRWPQSIDSEIEAQSVSATVFHDGTPICSVGTILFPEE